MRNVLLTGAAGGIATWLRQLLPPLYPGLVLSDMKEPANLKDTERFIKADLTKPAEVAEACRGIEGIIHLGGYSGEGSWDTILNANIIGCYNLFEEARKAGVKRVVFASSNHACGFYPTSTVIPTEVNPRPDSCYGVSKAFGEAVGAMYAFKHGMGVTSLRIGNVGEEPLDVRRLAIFIHPEDLVQLIRIGLERPDLVYEVMYGVSDNTRSWYDNSNAERLGYAPKHDAETQKDLAYARQAKLKPDAVAEFYQGGTFAAAEYTADFATMKGRS